jgi:competence protein ComEA
MRFVQKLFLVLMLCWAGVVLAADVVNINTADADTLMKVLKGVGPDKAAAIVAYRSSNGPFKSADDLMEVKGIGKRLIEMNRDKISIGKAVPEHE